MTGNRFQSVATLQVINIVGSVEKQIPAEYIIYNKESRIGQIGAGELAIDSHSKGVLVIPDEVSIPFSTTSPLHIMVIGEDAFKKLKGANKELVIVPGASHIDLYDNKDAIPFDKLADFFKANLK